MSLMFERPEIRRFSAMSPPRPLDQNALAVKFERRDFRGRQPESAHST
jgi:hypothetical protein